MPENEILAAYKSIPICTRFLLTATIVVTLGTTLGFVPHHQVMLSWHHILYKFQLHRLVTNLFVTSLGFSFLFDLYFLHNYGTQLEQNTFAGRPADFAWFLIFTSLTSAVIGPYFGSYYLFQSLLLSIIYLWSQSNADRTVSFMFGFTFKAVYFPWVLVAYTSILSGAAVPWTMLIGIASAHLYCFLDTIYPSMGGPRLIPTPPILYKLLPGQDVSGAEFAAGGTQPTFRPQQAAAAGGATATGGHRWGSGNRLG